MSEPSAYLRVSIEGDSTEHVDRPFSVSLRDDLLPPDADLGAFHLVELASASAYEAIPAALHRDRTGLTLTGILTGALRPGETRTLALVAAEPNNHHRAPLVSVREVDYLDQPTYEITTQNAVYRLHRHGAGFASMIDTQGNDWISYRPGGGSAGEYRGIPNIKNPHDYFHPGAMTGRAELIAASPIHCRIEVATLDGACQGYWDIYPTHATLMLEKAIIPYWFLYEGTPGGKLDEEHGYIVRSSGVRTSAGESWDEVLQPAWLYFGAPNTDTVLYFIAHESELALSSYWPMQHNMTVFGFGRKDLNDFLRAQPARFTIGFAVDHGFESVRQVIQSLLHDPLIRSESVESAS